MTESAIDGGAIHPVASEPPALPTTLHVAGFWRRLGAFAIDAVVLGVIGLLLGAVFGAQFIAMGSWGRIVGFVVSALYLVPLNSALAGGRTLGKRALGLRVVDASGQTISLIRSFVRFLPLGVAFALNNISVTMAAMLSVTGYLICVLLFGALLPTIYLYLFNRSTRQLLHDLIVGSYVVHDGGAALRPLWRGHRVVVALLVIVTLVAPVYTFRLAQSEMMAPIVRVQTFVEQLSWVRNAKTVISDTFFYSPETGKKTQRVLEIVATLRDADIGNEARARQIACPAYALAADRGIEAISITLLYGYDIGIAWKRNTAFYANTVAAWGCAEEHASA